MAKTLNSNLRRFTFMYRQFRAIIFSEKNMNEHYSIFVRYKLPSKCRGFYL